MTSRIVFVSCAYATKREDQPAWKQILALEPLPDLLLLLGDTAYMNWEGNKWEHNKLEACYEKQFKIESFVELTKRVPTLAIWDDHDCGINNVYGGEHAENVARSRKLFDRYLHFAVNAGRPEMYAAYDALPDVRILMLDGRTYRTDPYGAAPTLLGREQEDWLFEQLDPQRTTQKPITIVANGTGLTEGGRDEVVSAYPGFSNRLRQALSFRPGGPGPVGAAPDVGRRALFLSGDVHRNVFKPHKDERIYEALSSAVACFITRTSEEEFGSERYCDNWALLTIDEHEVTFDFHGRPNKPKQGKDFAQVNNFSKKIRRSDWTLLP